MKTNKIKLYWQMIKSNPKNIWWWIQGYYRYFLKDTFLVRGFIKEQYNYRIDKVNPDCLSQGSCVLCTCKTKPLLFADKPCAKSKLSKTSLMTLFNSSEICFDKMLSKKEWKQLISKY